MIDVQVYFFGYLQITDQETIVEVKKSCGEVDKKQPEEPEIMEESLSPGEGCSGAAAIQVPDGNIGNIDVV